MSFSFIRLGKFAIIISSNRFFIPCSLSSPSGIPIMQMCCASCCPKYFLSPHFLNIFFLFCAVLGCFFLPYLPNCLSEPLLHLTYCLFLPVYIFISYIAFFISDWSFFMVSVSFFYIVEYPYNHFSKLSDKLLFSISSSFSSGEFSCSFTWICFYVFPFWLLLCICFFVLGGSSKARV